MLRIEYVMFRFLRFNYVAGSLKIRQMKPNTIKVFLNIFPLTLSIEERDMDSRSELGPH